MGERGRTLGAIWAIVVAGGSGTRYGRPKLYELIHGRPVIEWAIGAARDVASGVVAVLPASDLDRAAASTPANFGADVVVAGGVSRSQSVRAGLKAVPHDADVVIVHDGARPAASMALFEATLHALRSGAAAALPGLALTDTIKRVDADGRVVATLDRADLVAVQTPQAFLADALRRAHASGDDATDDAALVERLGMPVVVVPGEASNVKLTTPADLSALAATLGAPS